MGFWDTLGKIVNSAQEKVNEFNEESNSYADKYSDYSKEELIDKYKNGWGGAAQKMGIAKVMKEKGYINHDDDN